MCSYLGTQTPCPCNCKDTELNFCIYHNFHTPNYPPNLTALVWKWNIPQFNLFMHLLNMTNRAQMLYEEAGNYCHILMQLYFQTEAGEALLFWAICHSKFVLLNYIWNIQQLKGAFSGTIIKQHYMYCAEHGDLLSSVTPWSNRR